MVTKISTLKILLLTIIFVFKSFITNGQSKAAEIDGNAIKIELSEFDQMEPFYEGFAVIQKGQSTAIINKQGEFLVPFNKYQSTGHFFNGYCMVFRGGTFGSGIIDRRGEEIVPCRYYMVGVPDQNGFVLLDTFGKKYIVNLKSKKRYETPNFPNSFDYEKIKDRFFDSYMIKYSNGLIRFYDEKIRKYGYKTISSKTIIDPQFDDAEEFSEGLAVVSKNNDFGERKFGFIDTAGKSVIPFNFSKKPGSFYKNRAFVEPKDHSEFNFGYIDKRGDLKIKLTTSQPRFSKDFRENFIIVVRGNNLINREFVDTNGVEVPFPKVINYGGQEQYYDVNDNIVDGQLIITCGLKYGIINLRGEVVIPPIFKELSYIDPVSKLAKARYDTGNNKYVEGYINEKGVFVIIKVQASKW